MDILRPLRAVLILILFSSCAKIGYLTEQGLGQMKILTSAKENSEVLKDPNVSEDHKVKIRKIEKYKQFFYQYWQREASEIYSETTLLERDAVTYLVIASKPTEVKAKKECFLFYGCFPYLGFFDDNSAKDYVSKLEENGHETYKRRVLAYSTLGTFDDPILSTFFQYSEYDLAETIFHELFHTIFFIDDEVDLNENLANYFGKQMLSLYFKDREKLKKHFENEEKSAQIMQEIVAQSKNLESILKRESWQEDKKVFLERDFPKAIQKKCDELKVNHCWPLKMKWNNATFAAFNTYEKSQDKIKELGESFNGDLKKFFVFIESRYKSYQKKKSEIGTSFEKYLLSR